MHKEPTSSSDFYAETHKQIKTLREWCPMIDDNQHNPDSLSRIADKLEYLNNGFLKQSELLDQIQNLQANAEKIDALNAVNEKMCEALQKVEHYYRAEFDSFTERQVRDALNLYDEQKAGVKHCVKCGKETDMPFHTCSGATEGKA